MLAGEGDRGREEATAGEGAADIDAGVVWTLISDC